ncbi:uncharacterized protein [Anabrus simplex]|uniref:uncharacterized protein n=1 Tax=Anabrus simplex TaxID=316456 RepID=UPI0035A3C9B4
MAAALLQETKLGRRPIAYASRTLSAQEAVHVPMIFKYYHETPLGGHLAIFKTREKIREMFIWKASPQSHWMQSCITVAVLRVCAYKQFTVFSYFQRSNHHYSYLLKKIIVCRQHYSSNHSSVCSLQLKGPYEITIVDVHECEDVGTHQHQFNFKIRKVNATTRLLQANVSYLVAVNENISTKISSAKWSSGGWGKNAFNKDFEHFCGAWQDYMPDSWEPWCIELGIPKECPIAAI